MFYQTTICCIYHADQHSPLTLGVVSAMSYDIETVGLQMLWFPVPGEHIGWSLVTIGNPEIDQLTFKILRNCN